MCLAAFALNAHPRFPLVIAANRDEFFAREATPMAWWADHPNILAGRDLSAGGTWFGLSRQGRLALLTNVREPGRNRPDAPSRGALVTDWLASSDDACGFVQQLPTGYNGFNLIMADLARDNWQWFSNRRAAPVVLAAGIHTLSNAALDTPWPKTTGLAAALSLALDQCDDVDGLTQRLFAALADRAPAADADLPDTGVGLSRERQLSPRFIHLPDPAHPDRAFYGTRCSTVLIRAVDGSTQIVERTFNDAGAQSHRVTHRLAAWP